MGHLGVCIVNRYPKGPIEHMNSLMADRFDQRTVANLINDLFGCIQYDD